MTIFNNPKEKIILISVVNLLFLRVWVALGIFNYQKNYFSMEGVDKVFFLLEIIIFLIFFILIFILLKKVNYHVKYFILFSMIVLSLNNLRVVTNISLFKINLSFYFFLIVTLIVIFFIYLLIFNKKFFYNFLDRSFNFLGIIFFPFFLIIILKLMFGLIYLKNYEKKNFYNENHIVLGQNNYKKKDLVIWIIFEQFDTKLINKNLMYFPNLSFLMSKSDIYSNYDPKSFETIRAVAAATNGIKNPDEYELKIKNRNIDLYLGKKNQLKNISETDSVFKHYYENGYKTYINSWYIPQCRYFYKYISKCFQVPYGSGVGGKILSFYNIENLFYFHVYNFLPGSSYLKKIDYLNNKLDGIYHQSYTFNWYKDNFLLQRDNFIKELKNNDSNFLFHQSIIAHPPIFYNKDTKKLFKNYTESLEYLQKNRLNTITDAYNFENYYLLDDFLGDIIQILKDRKIFDDTTIVINGDTGLSKEIIDSNQKNLTGSTFIIIKKKEQNTQNILTDYIDPRGLFERLLKISVK